MLNDQGANNIFLHKAAHFLSRWGRLEHFISLLEATNWITLPKPRTKRFFSSLACVRQAHSNWCPMHSRKSHVSLRGTAPSHYSRCLVSSMLLRWVVLDHCGRKRWACSNVFRVFYTCVEPIRSHMCALGLESRWSAPLSRATNGT